MAVSTTVFQAFPNAIEQGWQIARMDYSTIAGNVLDNETAVDIDIIIDEISSTSPNPSPNAQGIDSDTLIYVRPEQMPTWDAASLTGDYAIYDTNTDKVYSIVHAGIGRNQETGTIEHIELQIRQTGSA